MMTVKKMTKEDDGAFYFDGTFADKPVEIILLKHNAEIMLEAESFAKVAGYESNSEMMSDDSSLDLIKEMADARMSEEEKEWEERIMKQIWKIEDKELRDKIIVLIKGGEA